MYYVKVDIRPPVLKLRTNVVFGIVTNSLTRNQAEERNERKYRLPTDIWFVHAHTK